MSFEILPHHPADVRSSEPILDDGNHSGQQLFAAVPRAWRRGRSGRIAM